MTNSDYKRADAAQALRRAAEVLRAVASQARAGRWIADGAEVKAVWANDYRNVALCNGSIPIGNEINASYIAMVNPRLGLLLADWLDAEARECDQIAEEGCPGAVNNIEPLKIAEMILEAK